MARHAATLVEVTPQSVDQYGDVAALGTNIVVHEEEAALSGLKQAYWLQNNSPEQASVAHQEAEAHLQAVQLQLADTRAALRNLLPQQKEQLDGYLTLFLGASVQLGRQGNDHTTLADWLADPHHGASDEQLFDFLGAHVAFIASQQRSPEFQSMVYSEKQAYLAQVQEAVNDGHFSSHALQTGDGVMNTAVYIGDVWDTLLKGRLGYHVADEKYMVIAQARRSYPHAHKDALQELAADLSGTLYHEGDHVQFGHWEVSWFREAMAEHDALSLIDGKFYALRPSMRGHEDSNIYVPERELVATLCEDGPIKINADVVMQAHTSSGPDSTEWRRFMAALDKAWGAEDVYSKVTARIFHLEDKSTNLHPDWSARQCYMSAVRSVTADLRDTRQSGH